MLETSWPGCRRVEAASPSERLGDLFTHFVSEQRSGLLFTVA
jgi:hypothetical protein